MDFANRIRAELMDRIGPDRFELWFDRARFEMSESTLRIMVESAFTVDRLKRQFATELRSLAREVSNADVDVEILVGDLTEIPSDTESQSDLLADKATPSPIPSAFETAPGPNVELALSTQAPAMTSEAEPTPVVRSKMSRGLLRANSAQQRGRRFRSFETLVPGVCNQLARASVDMIAEQPGEVSPLVLHGPTGVGKTHLLEAIWTRAKKKRRLSVVYLSAEQFTSYFLDALKNSGLASFRRKYRKADVLLIDDIQFLAGKQATLVELTYTIDELARENRQLVLTADRTPTQLAGVLGRELTNRLTGGLVCGLKAIDNETMKQIAVRWAAERQMELPRDVLDELASRMHGDARVLSGVLNRLRATSIAHERPVSIRMLNEIVQELVPIHSNIIRLKDVSRRVSQIFGFESELLQQQIRRRAISQPRMLAMYLAKKHTAAGLHEISDHFGRRSHSSAVTAHKTVQRWIDEGMKIELNGQKRDVRDVLSQIETELRAG